MSAMTTPSPRLRRLFDPGHRKALIGVLVALALLALSIPIGLAVRDGAGGSAGQSASVGSGFAPEPGSASGSGAASDSGSGSATGSGSAVAPGAPVAPEAAKDAAGATAGTSRDATGSASSASSASSSVGTVVGQKIARSAWLGIEVANLTSSSAEVRAIAMAAGGQVVSENVVTDRDPTGAYGVEGRSADVPQPVGVNEARLTLSVPAERLDGVLAELSRIGTVSYRSSQSQDVTDAYVDVQARIGPMRDSITRVRALLAKATDLQQIVLLESELTRRQAELDSLTQRLAELDRITTTSDVTVTLWTAAVAPVEEESGFVGALRTAWDRLLSSLEVILIGLAVLAPWILLALLVAWAVRGVQRRRATTPSGTTGTSGTSGVAGGGQPGGGPSGAGPAPATD